MLDTRRCSEGLRAVPRTRVQRLVVLLHGVGASAEYLFQHVAPLAARLPGTAFFAPDAPFPHDREDGGRQWFSVRERRTGALLAGARDAAPLLTRTVDAELARFGLPATRAALLGFSQGAMMALHVALRRDPGMAVAAFSGMLVAPQTLRSELRGRAPVLLVHGDADDEIPIKWMHRAQAALAGAQVPVRTVPRPGLGHAVDDTGLAAAARFIDETLPATPVAAPRPHPAAPARCEHATPG